MLAEAGSNGLKRVSKDALLPRGAQLLIPTSAALPAAPKSTPTGAQPFSNCNVCK